MNHSDQAITDLRAALADPNRVSQPSSADPRKSALRAVRKDEITNTKTEHPADGSPRWIVSGPTGSVTYDVLGNHLVLKDPAGDVIDAMGTALADEVRAIATHDGDAAVFELLGVHYRTELTAAVAR